MAGPVFPVMTRLADEDDDDDYDDVGDVTTAEVMPTTAALRRPKKSTTIGWECGVSLSDDSTTIISFQFGFG
ncbi:hypothetical protein Hdeb2414_s0010g00335611 [Helianthus debilis subsp. tardiflorus]